PVRLGPLRGAIERALREGPAVVNLPEPPPSPVAALHGRVLIVEDNPTNQLLAQRMLERLGLRHATAANGLVAVAACRQQAFDLILMDCQMPELDGYAATRQIRSDEMRRGRRIPIIAMTANAIEGERGRCLAAGMDDYLAKPVQFTELAECLARWLSAEAAT